MAKAKSVSTKDGIKAMMALGFSQAAYARMFGVDSATVNQWYKFGRVGARTVGRVEHIKELSGKLTIKALRPDLDDAAVADARALAKVWKSNLRAKVNLAGPKTTAKAKKSAPAKATKPAATRAKKVAAATAKPAATTGNEVEF